MKIAVLCVTHAKGGLELNMIRYTLWLSEWCNVVFIGAENSYVANELAANGINVQYVSYNKQKHFNFRVAKQIYSILQKYETKIMLIGHYEQHYTAVIAKLYIPKLKLMYLQQMQLNVKKRNFYHNIFFRGIDIWFTPLNYLMEQLLTNTALKHSQIKLLPLCLDTEKFTMATASKSSAKYAIGCYEEDFVIGSIGRLDASKGQEYLLWAFPQVLKVIPNAKIILVGDETEGGTGYKEYLLDLANELNISGYIKFYPFNTQIEKMYQAMDVFVMSSVSEPIGMVTIEAMLSKVPVIGADSGGTPEILLHGQAGYLIPPKDSYAIAEKILHVCKQDNREELQQKITLAFETVAQMYSKKYWTDIFKMAIQSVV